MYALSVSAEGDCYWCVPPDPGEENAALGASECALPGTSPAEALHTFTLDSGASRCFIRDSTTLTPFSAPVPVRLADPSRGPVLASSSSVLPCPAVPSGSLSGLHLPSFSTNLVSTAALQDAMVTTTTPGGQRVLICTCTRTGRHLVTSGSTPSARVAPCRTRPSYGTTTLVTPPCHAFVAWTPTSLFLVFLGLCLPSRPPLFPPCLPCVERRPRAAPHSSLFPLTTTPLQTLNMDVWGPARVCGQGREHYFLLLREDLPVLRLHSDRGGKFSFDLLWDFCRGEGILQLFTLPASPQQNGIAERRIGLVMEVARTSMINAAAPPFLWLFAVRYAAHQLILWPRVSLPKTSPTLCWRGKVGDASVFRIWGSRAFVHDTSADKLSARAIPCGPAPSGVSQVDPLPGTVPVEVAVDSGAARGAESRGAASGGVASGGAEAAIAEPRGAEPEGAEPAGAGGSAAGGIGSGGAGATRLGGAGVTPGARGTGHAGAAGPGGACTRGTGAAGAGGIGGAGVEGARAGGTGAGGAGVGGAGAGDPGPRGAGAGGTGARDPGARCTGAEDSGAGGPGAGGAGAGRARAGDTGAGGTGVGGTGARDPGAGGAGAEVAGAGGSGAGVTSRPTSPVCAARNGHCVPRPRPPLVPGTHIMALRPSSVPLQVPMPPPLDSSLPAVSDPESDLACAAIPTAPRLLATVVTGPLFEYTAVSPLVAKHVDFAAACRLDYATSLVAKSEFDCPASVRVECALCRDILEDRQEDFECLAAAVPHLMAMLLVPEGDPDAPDIPTPRSYAEVITGPYSSQWQTAMDAEMASWKSTGTNVDAVPPPGANIVDGMWIFRVKRPHGSPPIFKACYVARGFSQRQGVEFSTAFLQGSLHEEIWLRRPPGFTGSFPVGTQWSLRRPVYGLRQAPREWHDTLKTMIAALGFASSTADPSLFLRTDTSLLPFYILMYVDDFVFATADTEALALVKSEPQKRHTCTDLGELRSYLDLQITRERARRTITLTQSYMVDQVLQRFGFRYSSPQSTPLPTGHSLSAPPSDESVEPSGPYPELVGCLVYLMTCTRPDLAYPLSILARYVALGRNRLEHWEAAKRVLRYLCSTSGMGLVLGGRGPVVLTGYADASWVDNLATQRSSQGYTFSVGSDSVSWRSTRSSSVLSSSCEAEIYAGAMAAQELR
ncbi:unnamed protein product [Closterium sp. NIES-54]